MQEMKFYSVNDEYGNFSNFAPSNKGKWKIRLSVNIIFDRSLPALSGIYNCCQFSAVTNNVRINN